MPSPTASTEIADRERPVNASTFRMAVLTLLFSFSIWAQSVPAKRPTSTDDAVRALTARAANIRWDRASVVTGDIACDKRSDTALLGHSDNKLFLGFFRAKTRQLQILEFRIGGGFQNGICQLPAKLETEPVSGPDYPVPGFRESEKCKGLIIADDDCDPIHLFWNHDTHQLNWWRN